MDIRAVVTECADLVERHYLDAAVGARCATALRRHRDAGAYDGLDEASLAERVSHDLADADDRHLRLKHHPDPIADPADEVAWLAEARARADEHTGGVRRAERLRGNVGLLELAPELFPTRFAGPSITAAMTLLASCRALIIDLRAMRGGDPGTVALICSYLLPPGTHLNTMVPRDPAGATQSWTLPWVPGPHFGDGLVYVLTSARTFSGGEELAYDLQQLGRATVVGEVTGGGANAREGFRVAPHLELCVPVVAARNPVTGTNWERVGVRPDVPVPAADALRVAHDVVVEHLQHEPDLSPALRRELVAAG
ncbi:S41 family peptidase [Jatrophihabitans fulvus]